MSYHSRLAAELLTHGFSSEVPEDEQDCAPEGAYGEYSYELPEQPAPSVWQMAERQEALLAMYTGLTEGMAPGPERTEWFQQHYPTIAAELADLDREFAEMDK